VEWESQKNTLLPRNYDGLEIPDAASQPMGLPQSDLIARVKPQRWLGCPVGDERRWKRPWLFMSLYVCWRWQQNSASCDLTKSMAFRPKIFREMTLGRVLVEYVVTNLSRRHGNSVRLMKKKIRCPFLLRKMNIDRSVRVL
jgi:hypothetical protein